MCVLILREAHGMHGLKMSGGWQAVGWRWRSACPVNAWGSTDLHVGEHPRQLSAHAQVCNLEQALQEGNGQGLLMGAA